MGVRIPHGHQIKFRFMINLSKLEILPSREKIRSKADYWGRRHSTNWQPINGASMYLFMNRLLKFHEGKSFDEAYSYLSHKVDWSQKYLIWYFLDREERVNKLSRRRSNSYFIDEDKVIRKYPREKSQELKIYSLDYRDRKVLSEGEYLEIIVSGEVLTFTSRKDPEYKKLKSQKNKLDKVTKKLKASDSRNLFETSLRLKGVQRRKDFLESLYRLRWEPKKVEKVENKSIYYTYYKP